LIWALIPAAGRGRRVAGDLPKQYRLLAGKPVILHTLERIDRHPGVRGFTVCLAKDDSYWASLPSALSKPLNTCEGGGFRARSVLRGLQAMHAAGEDDGHVLVHDAVRPCLDWQALDRVIEAGTADEHGALLSLPITEAVKHSADHIDAEAPRVDGALEHDGLWVAQTPQVFRADLLRAALESALAQDEVVRDEAAAMQRAGYRPRLVLGSPANFKITYDADLALARCILEGQ